MRLSHLMGCLHLQANRGAISPMRIDTPASGKGEAEFSQCLQQVHQPFGPACCEKTMLSCQGVCHRSAGYGVVRCMCGFTEIELDSILCSWHIVILLLSFESETSGTGCGEWRC